MPTIFTRYIIFSLSILAILAASGCNTTDSSKPIAKETKWVLSPSQQNNKTVVLVVGMSPETVSTLLGKPSRKRKRKRNASDFSSWVYERVLTGAEITRTMTNKTGTSFRQKSIRYETVTIKFEDNKIESVEILKRGYPF